jgi:hypothetical protein
VIGVITYNHIIYSILPIFRDSSLIAIIESSVAFNHSLVVLANSLAALGHSLVAINFICIYKKKIFDYIFIYELLILLLGYPCRGSYRITG